MKPEAGEPPVFAEYHDALDKARLLSGRGMYRRALYELGGAKLEGARTEEAGVLRARLHRTLGQYGEAEAALEGLKSTGAVIERARLKEARGDLAGAVAGLREVGKTDDVLTRFEVARLLDVSGDLAGAAEAYEWLTTGEGGLLAKWRADAGTFEDAAVVVALGRATDRWAQLTGAYQKDRTLHETVLGMFVRAYDVIDRESVEPRIAAAQFFVAHDDTGKAMEEMEAAAGINPRHPELLALVAGVWVDQFDFDRADAAIEELRRVNGVDSRPDLLLARSLLAQRQPLAAMSAARRVLGVLPANIEAKAYLAAGHALLLEDERMGELLSEIDAIDADDAVSRFVVAETLAGMRQYPRAAAMYQQAIVRAPWWSAPRNGLGLLYTQSGDEDAARKALDEAHAIDPFNLRTTNYLRLMDTLAGFASVETEHFVIYFDAASDPIIGELFGPALEKAHAAVAAEYRHAPAVKTLIEVFPNHDQFSVRTTGTPWIGTVGASTGRVIAMVSPRPGTRTLGNYHWLQVLKHEYTHTVTLSLTDNRIPHWMTEGLAVRQEKAPMPWMWVPMLYHTVTGGELLNLDEITWAFVRPKKATDRQLAYAQSSWMCQYIEETAGFEAILRMLEQYRAGKQQAAVFLDVLGKSESEFVAGFEAWAGGQVAGWGYDTATSEKYKELRERGEALIASKEYVEAVGVWEEIARLRPVDQLPTQRLAGLYLRAEVNRPEDAVRALKLLHEREQSDNRYAKRIARLQKERGEWAGAAEYAMQAIYINPYDAGAHKLYVEVLEGDASTPAEKLEQAKRWLTAVEERKP